MLSFNNFLISSEIGSILSTINCDKLFLKSEKFFPEKFLIVSSSEELFKHTKQFLKECPYWVAQMSQGYEYIYNFVDQRNWKSLKWLQFLGFEPKEKINDYGIGKMPFLLMMKEVNKIDVRSTTSPTSINSN